MAAAWHCGSRRRPHRQGSATCSLIEVCAARSISPRWSETSRKRGPRHDGVDGLAIRRVVDVAEFERIPHPAIGRLTTPLRRAAFERLRALLSMSSSGTRAFVAWLDGTPVGAIEVFVGAHGAGIHSLAVLDAYQGRGVGSALVEHACREAHRIGSAAIGLLATTEGQRLYLRRGFSEVAKFGYWYRSFQRGR